ncbi:MAG: CCA tRNA nucleotidyltransferase [Gemmatimonadota bacterium]
MTDAHPRPPGYVGWAARTLEAAGYETWAVGGAIRNTLLGLPSGDWDLATRAPPRVVQRLFPRTVPVGIEHGTVGVLTRDGVLLEVTTFRKDVETFGRHAVVEFAETLQEDLSRRDFTVNAIAWHPMTGEFRDPFHGRRDLEDKLLRTVGDPRERFAEDYLRVLRALRFSGRFRFLIQSETWKAVREAGDHLGVLSPERVREELMKILTDAPAPSRALSLYRLSGVLDALYPELAAVSGCTRPDPPEDLWTHSLLLADMTRPDQPLLRLASLFQGLGFPECQGTERGPASGQDRTNPGTRGRERTAALMMRLRFSNAEIRQVSELMEVGLEPPVALEKRPELRRWLHSVGPGHLPALARIWIAKARLDALRWARDSRAIVTLIHRLRREVRSGSPLDQADLALDGRRLIAMGMKPGPRFGTILDALMDQVLEDPSLNDPDTLEDLVLEWLESEDPAP